MRALLLVLSLFAAEAQAAKRLSNKYPSYLPTFGIGSTSSVSYTQIGGSTFQMLAPNGEVDSLVRVLTTTAAYITTNASGNAASNGLLLPANTFIDLEIPSGYKVSATPIATNGVLYATHLLTYPNND